MHKISRLSDEQITTLYNLGQRKGFEEMYHRYYALLLVAARRLTKNEEEGCDMVQDIFMKLYIKLGQVNIYSRLDAFLFSCLKYEFLYKLRTSNNRKIDFEQYSQFLSSENTPEMHLLSKELQQIIDQLIEELPMRMRHVFYLSRNQQMSYQQIASEMKITTGTVKKQVLYALDNLRHKLGSFF